MALRSKGYPEIPTILLTNDDGPCSEEESPFIRSFSELITQNFLKNRRENLKVVIPDSQKSWIGKAYIIKDKICVTNYDPRTGENSKMNSNNDSASSSSNNDDNSNCWKLVSGTPASCSNLGLFNLFPNQIDLVIAGPNFGRNTSSAFSLSSGTVGAAMDAALSNHRAIALSYGIFERPITDSIIEAANQIAVKIIEQLWKTGFSNHQNQEDQKNYPDLYSVNIPLVPAILKEAKVVWTTESRTRYARLFLPAGEETSERRPMNPGEIDEASQHVGEAGEDDSSNPNPKASRSKNGSLEFIFKPDITALIDPNASQHPIGSDAWALNKGFCTVTPLMAAFYPGPKPNWDSVHVSEDGLHVWKL